MNAYRIALILCRAVAIALWWLAGFRFMSVATILIIAQFNIGGLGGAAVSQLPLQLFISAVSLAIAAGFLQIFAASLAASMTGSASFEGETIASRHTLDAPERALGSAGAGLFLLFYGAAGAVPALLTGGTMILSGGSSFGTMVSMVIYNIVSSLILAALQCLVGFVLAFRLGLRRMMKSAE